MSLYWYCTLDPNRSLAARTNKKDSARIRQLAECMDYTVGCNCAGRTHEKNVVITLSTTTSVVALSKISARITPLQKKTTGSIFQRIQQEQHWSHSRWK